MASKEAYAVKTTTKSGIDQISEVEIAAKNETEQVVDTLVMAFASDPVARWLYPNPHDYLEYFPELVKKYGGKAFNHDAARHAQDYSGATLWLPPGVHSDDEELAAFLQNTMPQERCETALAAFGELEEYHPDEPHWHLPFLGVEPSQQCKGLGTKLLKHGLAISDEEDVPVYLESTNPQNVSLYLRHGFEVLGTTDQGTMPPFIPMVRRP